MISEEKMVHILHLMINGLYHADLVDYPDEDQAFREARKLCVTYVTQMEAVGESARQRIRTQKNAPMENSSQWEVLYQKYFDEELKKKGG